MKFIPKYKEKYYFVSHCLFTEPDISIKENIDSIDKNRIAKGNCFKTKLEAEKGLEKYKKQYIKKHGYLKKYDDKYVDYCKSKNWDIKGMQYSPKYERSKHEQDNKYSNNKK